MKHKELTINIPDDILISLNESVEELSRDMKIYSAMWLYIKGKLTTGKASQLAGMDKLSFESLLAENHVPISLLTEEDIQEDVNRLRESLR